MPDNNPLTAYKTFNLSILEKFGTKRNFYAFSSKN